MGDAMVKPSRLRKDARRTAGTERSYWKSFENAFWEGLMGWSSSCKVLAALTAVRCRSVKYE